MNNLQLSSWATKDFTINQFDDYLKKIKPEIVEISKDFVDGKNSIKKIAKVLDFYKKSNFKVKIVFAGTTDFVNCNNFSFSKYLKYIDIQIAQAKFIDASFFRVIVGPKNNEIQEKIIYQRLKEVKKRLQPLKLIIEVHNGWESSIKRVNNLLKDEDTYLLVDFQNLKESGLSLQDFRSTLKKEKIIYFHTRNIKYIYDENKDSLNVETEWCQAYPDVESLWEPKKLTKIQIKNIFYEHENAS